ncbi:hydrogen peroxide-inducible genes activator [Hellea balneolensis]|uniref:hydrogen peroxide-inducible genes activator n=1 Tax=Hellea balneolensis TaxID=287478 RepID=UPI0004104E90|nr:hydrogen peroxide-inducible genes activator [Hellea balneolensis]
MNLRDLDYICAVADLKHFGRAAERCHVSQPTLSGQIKKLEEQLGVTLFERSHKGIRVTDIGEDIISIAREARDAAQRIKAAAAAAQDPLAGTLSLGLIPTIAPYLIPLFVARIQTAMPNLSVAYREDITDRLNEALLKGELDAAILATPPEDNNLCAIELYSEPFWLLFPEGHELRKLEEASMKDVKEDDVLLLTEGHCFRDQALSICRPVQKRRRQSLRATSLETLINLVASGQGVTLVPALAMRGGWSKELGLSSHELTDEGAERQIYLTYRKRFPRIKAVKALAALIQEGLPESVKAA